MTHRPFQPRRVMSVLLFVAVGVALVACSRKDKTFNPVVTGPVTWNNTIHHLLSDRSEGTAPTGCTGCHHAGTGIPDWSSYATVFGDRTTMRSYLSPGGPMRQFLKPGEPEVVIGWIDAGAPE